jgi:hypothetical protein
VTGIDVLPQIVSDIPRVSDNGSRTIDPPLDVGKLAANAVGLLVFGVAMQEVQVVNCQYHRHPVVQREIPGHLVRDMPEGWPLNAREIPANWPEPTLHTLFPPGPNPQGVVLCSGDIAEVCFTTTGQEQNRLEPIVCQTQQFLAKVEGEPPQAAVDVPQLFKVDHHPWQRTVGSR